MPFQGPAVKGKYIDILSDFGFKHLLGREPNKGLLIDFLNALFEGEKVITDLEYCNTERAGDNTVSKKVFFDLLCTGNRGEQFLIEMQRAEQSYFKERSVFYLSRLISDQLPRGLESYDYGLKEVYMIALLEFVMPDSGELNQVGDFVHDYCLMNRRTGKIFYNKLGYKFIELPKFVRSEAECETDLEKWLYVLKHMHRLDKIPLLFSKPVFTRLFKIAEVSKLNKEEKHMYDVSLKYKWDQENMTRFAVEKAEKQGKEEGILQGKLEAARKMKKKGYDRDEIVSITGACADFCVSGQSHCH